MEKSISTVIDHCTEVVIINQKSTDRTLEIARRLEARHKRIKVHDWNEDFDQICEYVARNRAIKLVSGDWVAVLDADQLMSTGWPASVCRAMHIKGCDAIRCRYEHYVGSYEHIHTSFYEKQKNNELHPDVPLWQTVFFRNRPDLEAKPACASDPRFREFHHASFDPSLIGRMFHNDPHSTVFHYGFSKKNMMEMSLYRIHRGDYGHDEETKRSMSEQLIQSGNPFKFIGPVHRVDYGEERVPPVMRPLFGKTWKLDIDDQGFIQSRTHIPSGKVC